MSTHAMITRTAADLTKVDRISILHTVSEAAARRYILYSATSKSGDLSIDLDRVHSDLPAAFRAILAIVEERRAELNSVASRE